MKELIGKKILGVLANPDNTYWRFSTDQGDVDYFCFADCCSDSWINHINGVDELIGGTVADVEDIDFYALLKVEPEPTKQESDEVMFHRIKTEKGMCTFEFRNSSNGYYGGSLDYVEPDDTRGFKELTADLAHIKEDF
jgi:hypothetical protein